MRNQNPFQRKKLSITFAFVRKQNKKRVLFHPSPSVPCYPVRGRATTEEEPKSLNKRTTQPPFLLSYRGAGCLLVQSQNTSLSNYTLTYFSTLKVSISRFNIIAHTGRAWQMPRRLPIAFLRCFETDCVTLLLLSRYRSLWNFSDNHSKC